MSDTDSHSSGSGAGDGNTDVRIGRWSKQEHARFMEAYKMFGKDWRRVAEFVGTRNNVQVRTHAQKSFKKMRKMELARLKTQRIIAAHRSGLSPQERDRLLEHIEFASQAELYNKQHQHVQQSLGANSAMYLPFPKLQFGHHPDVTASTNPLLCSPPATGFAAPRPPTMNLTPLDIVSSASSSSLGSPAPTSASPPQQQPPALAPNLLLSSPGAGMPGALPNQVFHLNGTVFPRLAALSSVSAQQMPLPPAPPRLNLPGAAFKFLQDWSVDVK